MDYQEREEVFLRELEERGRRVRSYLLAKGYRDRFFPEHLCDSVYSYINSGGKFLRSAVLLFSCGAAGGDEAKALPAAAGIELFHTWTLVHDDIIDRDTKRRGGPTVHEEFFRKAVESFGFDEELARHYGISIGILAGDAQHGWAISLFAELATKSGLDPSIVLYLIEHLDNYVLNTLVAGEVLDIQYSRVPVESLNEVLIMDMLWRKTGALYEFAGMAGTMIGLETNDPEYELIKGISSFSSKCGVAFQLQDDILGVIGDEELLGKPVGSDIREGKRTTVVYYAYQNASERQKRQLLRVLGNANATEEEVGEVKDLLVRLGGVEKTQALARRYVKEALSCLQVVPQSEYKELLFTWAEYLINREF